MALLLTYADWYGIQQRAFVATATLSTSDAAATGSFPWPALYGSAKMEESTNHKREGELLSLSTMLNFISVLPDELTVSILQHLDLTSLCRAAQTSKAWRDYIDNNSTLWRAHCQRNGLSRPKATSSRQSISWKTFLSEHVERCRLKRKWLEGEYSTIQDASRLETEKLRPLSVEDWSDILQAELDRQWIHGILHWYDLNNFRNIFNGFCKANL